MLILYIQPTETKHGFVLGCIVDEQTNQTLISYSYLEIT